MSADGDGQDDPLPEVVREDMVRAAELWETLRAAGKQLRYEVDSHSGRVTAELRDLDGAKLHAVPLLAALGTVDDEDDAPAA